MTIKFIIIKTNSKRLTLQFYEQTIRANWHCRCFYHYTYYKYIVIVCYFNALADILIPRSDCIPTYLDSCVYYSPVCLHLHQHSQHHHTVEQDLYMSLTYSVTLLHKSQNMLPILSNRPSHHQLKTNWLMTRQGLKYKQCFKIIEIMHWTLKLEEKLNTEILQKRTERNILREGHYWI